MVMTAPSKRLIVLFDGTDNSSKDSTNLWRTHELLATTDANNVPQESIYIPGVGTDFGDIVRGSIFGMGVADKIQKGYGWLIEHYQDGAEIYVFGFSRGAFSARSLVQMIATCGLTRSEILHEFSIKQTFDRYDSITRQNTEVVLPIWRLRYLQRHPDQNPVGWTPTSDDIRLMDETKVRMVKIRMAGLWDTVGALGKDAMANHGASTQKSAAHNVRPTKSQDYGYHALAVDEHRPMFDATLWRIFLPDGDSQDIQQANEEKKTEYACKYEQRWFIGAHSDVGGGYGDNDLPDLSLHWMMTKASALGLAFTHSIEPMAGVWHGQIHDSFKSFAGGVLTIWDKVLPGDQRNYREIGRIPKEVTTVDGTVGVLWSINETIDESVLLRVIEDNTYRPPNLVEYFRNQLKSNADFLTQLFSKYIPQVDIDAGIFPNIFTQRTQRIYANQYWNETGVFLRPDRRYRFKVVPNIGEPLRDANNIARNIEGEDWDSAAYKAAALLHGKRKDDAKWFALIGTVDKTQPWAIKDGAEFTVPVAGQLVCYFNDVQLEWFYGNNAGWVVLDIEQFQGCAVG
jgi:uncharacterized protein (DUF2235 family)